MIEILIDIGIFSNFFSTGAVLFREPIEFYYSYFPLIILFILFASKFPFYTPNLYLLIPLLFFGLFNVLIGNNTINNFFKIYFNIAINLIFYQYVMQYYKYDVKLIFRKYLNAVYLVSILGLFQFLCSIIHFMPGVDFRLWAPLRKWNYSVGGFGLRVNSIHAEASYLATIHAPAGFISLYKLFKSDLEIIDYKKSIIILLCLILTSSSLAFLGIFLSIILISLSFGAIKYFLPTIPIVLIIAVYTYNSSKDFKARVDGINKTFFEGRLEDEQERYAIQSNRSKRKTQRELIQNIHGSSFVLYNNYHVALKNLENNYLFGSGLGSHEIAYEKYNLTKLLGGVYKFNAADANSFFLRTLSEVGLVGIAFILFFMFKFFITKPSIEGKHDEYFWIFSNALFIVIFLQYLRQGNYTLGGFFFFCWMYYYNYINMINEEAKPQEKEKVDNKALETAI